jgi:glucose/mannose-6-phosphate isomerase
MSILDRPDHWISVDPQSMRSLLESFPEQVQAAAQAGRNLHLPQPGEPKTIVVTGLGGSAIGGDLARSITETQVKIPIIVNRNYDLPEFVNASTLIFACSYSGNTEETLSAYEQGKKAGASILCITSGGQLETLATANGDSVLRLPGGLPPRAALGHSLFALLTALEAMQIVPSMAESMKLPIC